MTTRGHLTQDRHSVQKDHPIEVYNPANVNGYLRAFNGFWRKESEKYPG